MSAPVLDLLGAVLEGRAADLSPEDRARVLAAALSILGALATSAPLPSPAPAPQPESEKKATERWLTPDEAAAIASVPRRTVYGWSRRTDWRRFTHRPSRKVLRIGEGGFRRWLTRAGRGWSGQG